MTICTGDQTDETTSRGRRLTPLSSEQDRAVERAVLDRVLAVRRPGPATSPPPWAEEVLALHCDLARAALEEALARRDLPRLARLYNVVHSKDFRGFTRWLPQLPDDLRQELSRMLVSLQDPATGHCRTGPFGDAPLTTVGMPATHDENVVCRIYLFGAAPQYPLAPMRREDILQPLAAGTRS